MREITADLRAVHGNFHTSSCVPAVVNHLVSLAYVYTVSTQTTPNSQNCALVCDTIILIKFDYTWTYYMNISV